MPAAYDVTFQKVDFRSCLLTYADGEGTTEVYLEQSAVPECDWVGSEVDLNLQHKRLAQVLRNIQNWANEQGLRLKFCREDELGIS
jgi:hypothetical protein